MTRNCVFLDEPTTGLDPQVRLEIHRLIQELREARCTVLITTHYIEEAERLCDRVAIVDEGKIIAMGTPAEIQAKTLGTSRIDLHVDRPMPAGEIPMALNGAKLVFNDERTKLNVSSGKPTHTLVELVRWIDSQGIEIVDIQLKRPTLEDVFIELTGKKLRE